MIADARRKKIGLAVEAFLNMHPNPTDGDWWKLAEDMRKHGYFSKFTATSDIVLTLLGVVYPGSPRWARM